MWENIVRLWEGVSATEANGRLTIYKAIKCLIYTRKLFSFFFIVVLYIYIIIGLISVWSCSTKRNFIKQIALIRGK